MGVMCYPVVLRANSADYGKDDIVDLALLAELASEAAAFFARFTRSAKPARQSAAAISEQARVALARSAATPTTVLEQLSLDASSLVRSELIFNPSVSAAILTKLAGDPDRFVSSQARARLASIA
ncbi:MAG TPA: hypothetical protein V6D08_08125 [Candidatus Obscuribacterales bacterium]